MIKKIILISSMAISFLNAAQPLGMPPSIPTLTNVKKSKNHNISKPSMPKECELLPPMMILLPPPMEEALVNCKNRLKIPKKSFAQKQLSRFLKKEVKIKKIEIAEGFNQVYKITYNSGVIFTNKSVDKFLK